MSALITHQVNAIFCIYSLILFPKHLYWYYNLVERGVSVKITFKLILCSVPLFFASCSSKKGSDIKSCAPPPSAFLFNYEIERNGLGEAEKIFIHSPDNDPNKKLRLYIFPWSARAGTPHTGHAGDDGKANMMANFNHTDNESHLVEVSGDGKGDDDGICEAGEDCGLQTSWVMAARPHLISPSDDFKITRVALIDIYPPDFIYIGTSNHWRIEGTICQYHYSFRHIGWVGPDLRAKMIAQGLPDPDTYTGPLDTNLLTKPILLDEGESVAIPHIIGNVSPHDSNIILSHKTDYEKIPRAQIEIPTRDLIKKAAVPIYSWQTFELQQDLTNILQKEMLNSSSVYYDYSKPYIQRWLIQAEAELWTVPMASQDKYNGIIENATGVYEKPPGDCSAAAAHPNRELCDDSVAIWPIAKGNVVYDSSLYDSPDVSYLALKSKAIVPEDPDNYFYGEILYPTSDLGLEGDLFFKWRQKSYWINHGPNYQKASYAFIPSQKIFKIHWGIESPNRVYVEGLPYPENPKNLPCDGTAVVCYDRTFRPDGVRRPGY